MYVSNVNDNNLNFERLKIKINGAEFQKHPEDGRLIKAAILNNKGIMDFFSNHRGKITVTSGYEPVKAVYAYPRCLRKVPSSPLALPIDQFELTVQKPVIKLNCLYSRAFALRNLFKKPVWINAGTRPNADTNWERCVNDALRVIKMLGKDTEKDMVNRGDNKLRDFHHVEERRLQVEKP